MNGKKEKKEREQKETVLHAKLSGTPRDQSAVMIQGTDHTFFISLWLILPLFLLCHQFHVKKQAIWAGSTGRRYIIGDPGRLPSPIHGKDPSSTSKPNLTSWDGHSRTGRAVA